MTTTINPNANGRKRPTLSDQINRLDQTLDGLADGLNDAVADAVKDAVGQAVREAVQVVLTDVLANPQVIAKLQVAVAPPASVSEPPKRVAQIDMAPITLRQRLDGVFATVRASIASLRTVCSEPLRKVRSTIGNYWRRIVDRITAVSAHWEMVRQFRLQILMALGIGILVGIVVLHTGPELGAVVSGIGGFVTTLTVQAGLWLRKMFATDIEQTA